MTDWHAGILLIVMFLIFGALREWRKSGQKRVGPVIEEKPVEQIHLKQLSRAWKEEKGERVINLADLSKNWREKPVYRHDEISAFYREMVEGKPNMKENVLDCVEDILEILDKEGE